MPLLLLTILDINPICVHAPGKWQQQGIASVIAALKMQMLLLICCRWHAWPALCCCNAAVIYLLAIQGWCWVVLVSVDADLDVCTAQAFICLYIVSGNIATLMHLAAGFAVLAASSQVPTQR